MKAAILQKLLSRKFWAAMLAALWWLISGTLTDTMAEVGWKVVAVILGYLVSEGARDVLIAYWRRNETQPSAKK